MNFAEKIILWYEKNHRQLPWRNTKDPYIIWLSEIILQQTRVEQGTPYFHRFTEAFPTLKHFAKADENQVLKLWEGLGYYSRARNMIAAAKDISENYNSQFPDDFEKLKSLKGIGDYTASAIASIAFNLPHAVVDGNVYRVLSRVFGIKTPIDSSPGKKEFKNVAQSLISKKNPAEFNQGVMELGAIICKPKNPLCHECPLMADCAAFQKKNWNQFPVKEKKTKIRYRYFNYVVINYKNQFYISKREQSDIWKGLYEFPVIETKVDLSEKKIIALKEFKSILGSSKYNIEYITHSYRHILSHQKITAKFIYVKMASPPLLKMEKVKKNQLKNYAFPRLITLFFEEYF